MGRFELPTSPLPRECSTPEPHGPMSGAGEGNRTLALSLEGFCSTTELHPQRYPYTSWWREKDSNLRSFRNRFTVCPLWPLGNPSYAKLDIVPKCKWCVKQVFFLPCGFSRGFFNDAVIFLHQLFIALYMLWIQQNAVYWTDLLALWFIIMSFTLSAKIRIDNINFFPLRNCTVRTLWFADIAIDAFFGNVQRHMSTFSPSNNKQKLEKITVYYTLSLLFSLPCLRIRVSMLFSNPY